MIRKNTIHPTAKIDDNVILGNYNYIGENVEISGFNGKIESFYLGDCNIIHDNTRILIGQEGGSIGDWNVLHNNILVIGKKRLEIGHNCWFGQNTVIDSSGGLTIGNGVRVGMYSQIWTHVGSGEIIEGCTLIGERKTKIEDEVWLVGSCFVASGITLGYRSICLSNSNITKNTDAMRVYGGNPAKVLEKINFWRDVTFDDKFLMMSTWVKEFCKTKEDHYQYIIRKNTIELFDKEKKYLLVFGKDLDLSGSNKNVSYFDLMKKTYTKKLTNIEREFYRYIFGHKARFIPV